MKRIFLAALLPCLMPVQALAADERPTVNFTGPLITPNAKNLPSGVVVIEPYLIYSSGNTFYDGNGRRQKTPASTHQWQNLVPMFVGITDRLQAQLTLGALRVASQGQRSGGARMTDTTARLQYMLMAPNADGTRPAISVNYGHRFATGAYHRLDANPLNGVGSGAEVDSLSLLTQHFIWLPNGRPLRWRAVAAFSPSPSRVNLRGVSTYGTPADFRGHVRLGRSLGLTTSAEYSIDEHWVLALDLAYDREESAWLTGQQHLPSGKSESIERRDPARSVYSIAPAVEYNFDGRYGIVAGVHYSLAGRHNGAFVKPMVAVNMVF